MAARHGRAQRAARRQHGAADAGVAVDGDGAFRRFRSGDHVQPRYAVRHLRQRLLLIARRNALAVGQQPDLQQMHRIGLAGIELAVADAGAGAHALGFAGADHGAAADAVLVLQCAIQDVGHDLHIVVRVRREPATAGNAILVDHAQRPETHDLGIIIVAERETVRRLQPAMIGAATVFGFAVQIGGHVIVSGWSGCSRYGGGRKACQMRRCCSSHIKRE